MIKVVENATDFGCEVLNGKSFAFQDIEYKIRCSGVGSGLLRQSAVGGWHVPSLQLIPPMYSPSLASTVLLRKT